MSLLYICAGIVYKGDGSNMYLKMSPRSRRLAVVLGDSTGKTLDLSYSPANYAIFKRTLVEKYTIYNFIICRSHVVVLPDGLLLI